MIMFFMLFLLFAVNVQYKYFLLCTLLKVLKGDPHLFYFNKISSDVMLQQAYNVG